MLNAGGLFSSLRGQADGVCYQGFYEYKSRQLYEIVRCSDGVLRPTPWGEALPFEVRTAAYDPTDGSLYALDMDMQWRRRRADGLIEDLGAALNSAGQPLPQGGYEVCEWLAPATLWLYTAQSDSFYRISLPELRYTSGRMSAKLRIRQAALNPKDGCLYAFDFYGFLHSIQPRSGFVHNKGKPRNLPVQEVETTAVWFTSEGLMWLRRAGSPALWGMDLENNALYELGGELDKDSGGGFGCSLAPAPAWFALPVLQLYGDFPAKNNIVRINWRAADEQLIDRYQVERSADGSRWEPMGEAKSSYRGQYAVHPYGEMDRWRQAGDTLWYRLATTERSGQRYLSPAVRFPHGTAPQPNVLLSPDICAANALLQIEGCAGHRVLVRARDAAGRTLLERSFHIPSSDYGLSLFCSGWARGWCTVLVCDEQTGKYWHKRLFLSGD